MKITKRYSIQGMGDIWLYEVTEGIVKWRTHPYVENLSKEFKKMIEKKELDHFADASKTIQTAVE